MKRRELIEFAITPSETKTEFRFRLLFRGLPSALEFELDGRELTAFSRAIGGVLEHHKIPIQAQMRRRAKPKLHVVPKDDE